MSGRLKRRAFITLLGGAAAAWPIASRAQPIKSRVGFLNPGSQADFGHHAEAFLNGLKQSGFNEGDNIKVEYRWAEGRYDRLPQQAQELVKLGTAVIAVGSPPATFAAKPQHQRYPSSSSPLTTQSRMALSQVSIGPAAI